MEWPGCGSLVRRWLPRPDSPASWARHARDALPVHRLDLDEGVEHAVAHLTES